MDGQLAELAARYVLGDVLSDDLPTFAVDALVRGMDTPSLAALAGATRATDSAELRELFEAALSELRIALPSRRSAAELLKVCLARKVLQGTVPPRQGASEIVQLRYRVESDFADRRYAGDGFDIAHLLGAYYSYDDVDEKDLAAHESIARAIIAECRRIVDHDHGAVSRDDR